MDSSWWAGRNGGGGLNNILLAKYLSYVMLKFATDVKNTNFLFTNHKLLIQGDVWN